MKGEKLLFSEIKKCLIYNEVSGEFSWNENYAFKKRKNLTKRFSSHGYLTIGFKGHSFYLHRLAWFIFYNKHPKWHIDHINGDTTDNRIENLRDVSHSENLRNMVRHRNGEFVGVIFDKNKRVNPWVAKSQEKSGDYTYLGCYKTRDEARKAIELFEKGLFKYEHKNKKAKFKGVYFKSAKLQKPWYAQCKVKSKRVFLGYFLNQEDANNAIIKYKEENK